MVSRPLAAMAVKPISAAARPSWIALVIGLTPERARNRYRVRGIGHAGTT